MHEAVLSVEVRYVKWETEVVLKPGTRVQVEPESHIGRVNQDAFTLFPGEYAILKGSPHVCRQLRLVEASC
jgi:hypothetical protein